MVFDSEISGFDETQNNLKQKTDSVVASAEVGSMEEAEYLLQKIKTTAPVASGTYREDWRIEKRPNDDRGDIFIVNSTEHGPYLVFPNKRMVGSSKADLPSQGIIHNVRGIVHSHRRDYRDAIIDIIKDALGL